MMLPSTSGHAAGYRFHQRSQRSRPIARVAKQDAAEADAVAVDRQSNSKGSRKAFSQAGQPESVPRSMPSCRARQAGRVAPQQPALQQLNHMVLRRGARRRSASCWASRSAQFGR